MDTPPTPTSTWDAERWEHTRLRRRMLTGRWHCDLAARVKKAIGVERAEAIGEAGFDLSSNVFAHVSGALAVLYDVPFTVRHADPAAAAAMTELLQRCGVVAQMPEVQRMTLGLREMLLRVDAVDPDPASETPPLERVVLCVRPVPPDLVEARPHPLRPGEPIWVAEAMQTTVNGKDAWVWEIADARPASPGLAVWSADRKDDLTVAVYGRAFEGPAYPWWDGAEPVLPYVLYHAAVGTSLWDPWTWSEIVFGTLQAGVLWTHFGHTMRNASWPQRWSIGVRIAHEKSNEGRSYVVTDPTTVAMFQPAEDATQSQIGQWQAGASPDVAIAAVESYEQRLALHVVPATDILRASGDPRSGYALALSREGRREAARRYEPSFRRADQRLLGVIAVAVNGAFGEQLLPTSGWDVTYRALPPTLEEQTAAEERILKALGAGLITQEQAVAQWAALTQGGLDG